MRKIGALNLGNAAALLAGFFGGIGMRPLGGQPASPGNGRKAVGSRVRLPTPPRRMSGAGPRPAHTYRAARRNAMKGIAASR